MFPDILVDAIERLLVQCRGDIETCIELILAGIADAQPITQPHSQPQSTVEQQQQQQQRLDQQQREMKIEHIEQQLSTLHQEQRYYQSLAETLTSGHTVIPLESLLGGSGKVFPKDSWTLSNTSTDPNDVVFQHIQQQVSSKSSSTSSKSSSTSSISSTPSSLVPWRH
jgi:type II secretory pathway pseudopilin PulG